MMHVAVIGGGYAGFAAATELTAAGIKVTLFEAAKIPGGRARRVDVRGLALDNGLHVLIGAYRETLRLIEKVSMPSDAPGLKRIPLHLEIVDQFRLRAPRLPAPLHLAWALATAKGLTLAERARVIAFILALRRQGFRLSRDISVAELLARHRQGATLCQYLWHPLCISALNTQPLNASAQIFVNVLRDSLLGGRGDSDFLLPTVDFSQLFPDRALRYIRGHGGKVLLEHKVDSVRQAGRMFTVRSANEEQEFSHVVLAVSPHRLHSVCADLPQMTPALQCVQQFEYRPIYSVYLQYAPSVRLSRVMLGLHAKLSQWVFDRGQLSGQAGLLGVVISADGEHEKLGNDDLARRVHSELAQVFPAIGEPLWSQVIAEKRATYACRVGVTRPEVCTDIPKLFLAGDYLAGDYPATLEAAVRSGVECARRIRTSS